jgi:hypothetical protein
MSDRNIVYFSFNFIPAANTSFQFETRESLALLKNPRFAYGMLSVMMQDGGGNFERGHGVCIVSNPVIGTITSVPDDVNGTASGVGQQINFNSEAPHMVPVPIASPQDGLIFDIQVGPTLFPVSTPFAGVWVTYGIEYDI